jgi:hypothetical protein
MKLNNQIEDLKNEVDLQKSRILQFEKLNNFTEIILSKHDDKFIQTDNNLIE